MARRIAKTIAWFLGGALALALAAYAVLFVANLNDRPPSTEVAALRALQNSASPVLSDDNSYVFMLGFAGPPDADPFALGSERYEWMERARPEFDRADDPLGEEFDFRALRSGAVAKLGEACSESDAECLRFLESGESPVEQWLADERWLLERYHSLISMTEFKEAVPFEMHAPLPPYGAIVEGQRLHIADAWRSAARRDAAAVSAALDRDLTFWRMVLEKSDVLITKMIATAAIGRHFKLGNLSLRRLPQDLAADGIPGPWRNPISDEERSMKQSFAGEWAFFDAAIRQSGPDLANSAWERVGWILLKPFWQPQDLSNRHARLMFDLDRAFDVPYDEIPRALDLTVDLQESAYRPFSRLYNFAGDLVMVANYRTFSDYAVRVSDLEGIRRAALLVAELRAAGTSKDEVVQRMLQSELVDPYTNERFAWVDGEGAIVFHGLQAHEGRSQHKLIF